MTDFCNEKLVKARKRHTCACPIKSKTSGLLVDHSIDAGRPYYRVAKVTDGNFSAIGICTVHKAILDATIDYAGFPEGGIDPLDLRSAARVHILRIGFYGFLRFCRYFHRQSRKAKA